MIEKIRTQAGLLPGNRTAQGAVCVLYLCALVLYVVWFGLSLTTVGKSATLEAPIAFFYVAIKRYLVFVLFCAFLLDAFLNGMSAKKLVFGVIAIILLQNVVSNIYADETQKCIFQFFVWILLAYPQRLESRYALNAVWITGAVFSGAIVALSVFGVIPSIDIAKSNAIVAHGFGFRSLAIESLFLSSLIMIWVYCKSRSWNWLKAAIALVLLGVVFAITGSRVNLAVGAVQVAVTCLLDQGSRWVWARETLPKTLGRLGVLIVPVLALFCLLLVALASWTDAEPLKAVYKIMGGGIKTGAEFFGAYGYPLFCERIEHLSRLDNTFIYIAMSCGLVCLACLMILYWRFAQSVERQANPYMSLLLILVAMHMIFDSIMFLPVYNPVLLAIGAFLAMGRGIPAFGTKRPKHARF